MADDSNVLDSLVAQVSDDSLRARLAREIELLRGSRRFGLVYDRHLPESVRLSGHPVRKGVKVTLRDESAPDRSWRVVGFTDRTRAVAQLEGDGGEVAVYDLVVVREFGEPVYPGLRSVERIANGPDHAPWHAVINGENFHVLQALRSTHREKVDLIYIDPPYNTGNEGWIYNDKYVDTNDRSRSSKWLSFLEKRLVIARDLLKPTGVIIVAIGDEEHHRLRMLLDQVFKPENFLANIVWQGNGKNDAKYTGGGVDYMVAYARSEDVMIEADIKWREPKPGLGRVLAAASKAWLESSGDQQAATRQYRTALRAMRGELEPAVFRYDQIDGEGRAYQPTSLVSPNPRPNLRYELLHPIVRRPVETPENGWRYSRDAMDDLLAEGRILFGPDETTRPRYKRFLTDQEERIALPSFVASRLAGTKRVEVILGDRRFPNPKDVEVLMRWFRMVAPHDAVALDFFGGSGTTTEAVIRLNAEDGGTRQSILVTNNEVGAKQAKELRRAGRHPGSPEWEERGVFEHVTRPRVSTVVTGTRPDGSTYSEGLAANVEMFELTYLDPGMVRRGSEFAAIAPLLWLEAGAMGERIDEVPEAGWALTPAYGILTDLDALAPFAEAVATAVLDGRPPRLVFVVTDSETEYRHAVERLPVGIETAQLYQDYLANYTVNTEGSAR